MYYELQENKKIVCLFFSSWRVCVVYMYKMFKRKIQIEENEKGTKW